MSSNALSSSELAALRRFAGQHPTNWKSTLIDLRTRGRLDVPELVALFNRLGPTKIRALRLPKANGGRAAGAKVTRVFERDIPKARTLAQCGALKVALRQAVTDVKSFSPATASRLLADIEARERAIRSAAKKRQARSKPNGANSTYAVVRPIGNTERAQVLSLHRGVQAAGEAIQRELRAVRRRRGNETAWVARRVARVPAGTKKGDNIALDRAAPVGRKSNGRASSRKRNGHEETGAGAELVAFLDGTSDRSEKALARVRRAAEGHTTVDAVRRAILPAMRAASAAYGREYGTPASPAVFSPLDVFAAAQQWATTYVQQLHGQSRKSNADYAHEHVNSMDGPEAGILADTVKVTSSRLQPGVHRWRKVTLRFKNPNDPSGYTFVHIAARDGIGGGVIGEIPAKRPDVRMAIIEATDHACRR